MSQHLLAKVGRPSWSIAVHLPRRGGRLFLLLILTLGTGMPKAIAGVEEADSISFSRDILPILSDHCFACHGPDAQARKADLRLDTKEGALLAEDPVIVPGESQESELYFRITSDDDFDRMPPKQAKRPLNPMEIERIRLWIDAGAPWGRHWAFEPPKSVEPPPSQVGEPSRNPIDRFVLDRLKREGIAPMPRADRETLIRRVTFDLTGLPPSIEEIDAFLVDESPDAFERLVDRLLASPRYGERMATEWLDLARFADTHGYQMDRYRAMWPWRDWVISAFNRNLPYDQFVIWQLAGDLLPNPTKEQRLATAFNRLHMQNEEGGVIEEEFRVAYVNDRVNTFGTAFLGLTLECARCHDHRFDPISQKDYYQLFAFFQNIDESGQTPYFTSAMPVPTLLLSDEAIDAKLADLDRQIAAKRAEIPSEDEPGGEAFARWLTERPDEPAIPGLIGAFDFEAISEGQVANSADPEKPARAHESPQLVPGRFGQSALLDGENGFTFPGLGHFNRDDPFTISLWLLAPKTATRSVVLHHSRAPIDAGSRGYELLLEDGRVAFGLHHMWPANSLKVRSETAIKDGQWTHVTVTYDGSSLAEGTRIYLDGQPVPLEVIRDGLAKDITYEGGEPDLAIGFRFRDSGFRNGQVDEFRLYDRRLSGLEAAWLAGRPEAVETWRTPEGHLTDDQRSDLLAAYHASEDPETRQKLSELHALRREKTQFINPIPEVMVMEELAEPKPAFILQRGDYDALGEPVKAETPESLPPFPSDQPRNRLGLARWLFEAEQPLTARVEVNRLWQIMFGTGLVETSDNFGRQGASPNHPELLDWLAIEFVRSGWDIKALLRLIAHSETYQRSSRTTPGLLERDPGNQLLARGPARRLSAEMLRDQSLAISGLLTERLGGPSVKPYQPEGLWSVAMGGARYEPSKGPNLYRRSLYTFWKRTIPPPSMIAFDAAEREVCSVQRQSTSTPLQALVLLNDPQLVEAARHLSARMLREAGPDDNERAAWLFRQVTGRKPKPNEQAILVRLLDEQRDLFEADPEGAKALISVGESPRDLSLDPVDLAAGTVLAQALLNHDEAVHRR